MLTGKEGVGAIVRGHESQVEYEREVGALDLNANRGRFGYEAQPRWGVSADKPSFSDSDKQANCLGECDRCNKPVKKKKEKNPTRSP